MSCWLWDLVTGDVVPMARTFCWWLPAAGQYLYDEMWRIGA